MFAHHLTTGILLAGLAVAACPTSRGQELRWIPPEAAQPRVHQLPVTQMPSSQPAQVAFRQNVRQDACRPGSSSCPEPNRYPAQPAPCGPTACVPPEPCGPARPTQPPVAPCRPKSEVHHVYVRVPEGGAPRPESGGVPPQAPPGSFVAPPQHGSVVQESGSRGISGLRIRFPEIDLRLPSIELPRFTRRKTGAHMEMESAVAPYVAGAGQYGRAAYGGYAPTGYSPGRQESGQTPKAESGGVPEPDEESAKRIDDLEKKLGEMKCCLDKLIEHLESQAAARAPGPPATCQPAQPRSYPVPLPPAGCDRQAR